MLDLAVIWQDNKCHMAKDKMDIENLLGAGLAAELPLEMRSEAIREGLPYQAMVDVAETLDVPLKRLAEILGMAPRTVARRRGGKLSLVESDRLYRVAWIMERTAEFMGSAEKARKWLKRPNFGLGGKVPLDLVATETGVQAVDDLLGRIEHGMCL